MALLKFLKGIASNLPATKTDGQIYFTTDEGMLYVDNEDERVQLNALGAKQLINGTNTIPASTVLTTASPVAIGNGGTGARTTVDARNNLDVYSRANSIYGSSIQYGVDASTSATDTVKKVNINYANRTESTTSNPVGQIYCFSAIVANVLTSDYSLQLIYPTESSTIVINYDVTATDDMTWEAGDLVYFQLQSDGTVKRIALSEGNRQEQHIATTATLTVDNWDSTALTQSITIAKITADNTVIVSPTPDSLEEYGETRIYASAQSASNLTFKCETVPTNDITVNIVILN